MQQENQNDNIEDTENEELYEHHKFTADKGQEVLRIDKFLLDRLANTSRNKIQTAAKNGNILVNGVAVKQNYKIKPEDEIAIVMPYPVRELELIPEDIPLDIIYEDDTVIVINKQANMVVHPGYGNYSGTLVNGLIHHFDQLPSKSDDFYGRPGLVHRLDKHTTGLMVVAKTEDALTNLSKQFYDRTTERRYHALVWGDVIEDEGTITGNLGRSIKDRKLMTVFPEGDYGKHAVTNYKVLRRFGYVTLVECKLETGRTHQIRAHMKHIGHTLFNDLEYGGDKVLKGTTFSKYKSFVQNNFALLTGQALHAKTLGFVHPKTKEFMRFDSDLPSDFAAVLERWEVYLSARDKN
ncbi:RluA family pseudouridine synthase [Brumimicrobium oceani]|uniref:Pseudouridine synthase n=1 Tax=Brumimicrobium oceani TaxID=2100725 RepID=A0A2U2XBB7_9FLAO|nr:RluA family pseudouridine synthase [Brumimicrobium oceani]PWH85050.1 RNA pseudouridine synthase [Brumimicrobium oceani]